MLFKIKSYVNRGIPSWEYLVRFWSITIKELFIKQIEAGVNKIGFVLDPTMGHQLEYLRLQIQEQNIILKLMDHFSNRNE